MNSRKFIKKIKKYSIISFILPLITINLCLVIFNLLGTVESFPNYNLSNGTVEISYKQNQLILNDTKSYSLKNCSKYVLVTHSITINNEDLVHGELTRKLLISLEKEGKIKTIKKIPGKVIDNRCIKNHPFIYFYDICLNGLLS